MKKNKVALLVVVACLTINTACTKSPEYEKSPQMPYVDDTYNQILPQSLFDGIPFPARKEHAKSAGFSKCVASDNVQFKCTTIRKIKFEGYEFESAYVLLNTNENLRDFRIIYDAKDFTPAFIASIKESARLASKSRSNDYTYHSVHLITDSVTNAHFLKKLENTAWVTVCDEGESSKCAYYNKEASYRIINHEHDGIDLKPTYGFTSHDIHKKIILPIHLEIAPLSPSEYGVIYNEVMKKKQLGNQTKELENQAKDKQQDFIKSMKN